MRESLGHIKFELFQKNAPLFLFIEFWLAAQRTRHNHIASHLFDYAVDWRLIREERIQRHFGEHKSCFFVRVDKLCIVFVLTLRNTFEALI